MQKYVVLDKEVGQTPLQCVELWRAEHQEFLGVPLSYAGRLDPMASGKLLVLIGDECKRQEQYHGLDKRYEFSVLLGVSSDTGDVLGRLQLETVLPQATRAQFGSAAEKLTGPITLPYPHFSSKTVQSKPLHVWTLEGRLSEIEIPTQSSTVYSLKLSNYQTKTRGEIYTSVSAKIETIPEVTETSKALGNDFRRVDVRADWKKFVETGKPTDIFTIATFACVASSGTYMRSLAEEIGKLVGTNALAYHIHRTHIGTYQPLPFNLGFWKRKF
jgi:tRNA pseudouridine(55) synthase